MERYRGELLDRTEAQTRFLLEHLDADASVLEVGCGNGRVLISLASQGRLASGLGLDLSRSRVDFARRWCTEAGIDKLRFEAADVLAAPLPNASFSAALVLTGAFGYFEPIRPGTAKALLERLAGALAPGGLLCLELYRHLALQRLVAAAGGEARVWTELPDTDPWRFYLSRIVVRDRVMEHGKTFIHRTSGKVESGRREYLYLYEPEEVVELLEAGGFRSIRVEGGWSDESADESDLLVVTARRGA